MRELENKIEIIENEIDLQVESLIAEIHKCSDELRSKLRNQKEELEKFDSFQIKKKLIESYFCFIFSMIVKNSFEKPKINKKE